MNLHKDINKFGGTSNYRAPGFSHRHRRIKFSRLIKCGIYLKLNTSSINSQDVKKSPKGMILGRGKGLAREYYTYNVIFAIDTASPSHLSVT